MQPLLTVMMPVYNAGRYVDAAVRSIQCQTLANIRILIIDDGSSDGSGDILAQLAQADLRIDLVRRGRRGQTATRNELLERATTDIVACADADDISYPDRLARQLSIFLKDPQLVVLGCQLEIIDAAGNPIGQLSRPCGADTVARAFEKGTAISQPSCLMRRSAILRAGGYRRAYDHAEDYDCFLRAAEIGKVDNADFVGIRYRVHENSVSHQHTIRQMASADLARATHRLRVAGLKDPTAELSAPPAYDDPLMKALVPAASIYRALTKADTRRGSGYLRVLLNAPVGRRQARATQRALLAELDRRKLDGVSARVLFRAARLGPGRALRHYFPSMSRYLPRRVKWQARPAWGFRLIPKPF